MKEEFLTRKCKFDLLYTILCAVALLLAIFYFAMVYENYFNFKDMWATNFFFVLGALHAGPPVACVLDAVCRSEAETLAQKLCVVDSAAISGAEFERIFEVKNAGEKISRLVRKKYLTGVKYDRSNDKIIFPDRLKQVDGFKRAYTCPHCGATGRLEPYAPARCEYCGGTIESVLKL